MAADFPAAVAIGPVDRCAAIYDRYATGLYRLAFYALADTELAEQVLCEVITAEGSRSPVRGGGPAGAGQQIAVAVYRRCRELTEGQAVPPDPAGPLTGRERDARGPVLFGKLDYRQAGAELGMSRVAVAALLLGALRRLAAPVGSGDDGQRP